MLNRILYLSLLILISSCASIRLNETYKLQIKSDKISKVKYQDSTYDLPTEIEVYRSKKPLKLIYIYDSIKKPIKIERKLHPNFIYGNIPIYSIGYLIDLTNSKRFYYGRTIILNPNDSVKVIREPLFSSPKEIAKYFIKEYPTKKGKFEFTISIPTACNFEMHPLNEGIKKSVGFGISIGSDYYYKKNKYLSLNLTAFADKFAPDGYFDIGYYQREKLYSSNISLSDNFKINRFSLGYGMNFSKNSWNFEKFKEFGAFTRTTYKSRVNYNLGFVITGYYQLFNCFYIGLNYRPTILKTYPTIVFQYNHVFGLDYQFRF